MTPPDGETIGRLEEWTVNTSVHYSPIRDITALLTAYRALQTENEAKTRALQQIIELFEHEYPVPLRAPSIARAALRLAQGDGGEGHG